MVPPVRLLLGPLYRGPVLAVPVDVVRNLIVHVDVVHLRDGQLDPAPALATVRRDRDPLVVADDHAARVHRVDPHVVVVSAPRAEALDGLAAILGHVKTGGREVDFVGVVRRDDDPGVVERPIEQGVVAVDERPGSAGVIRSPEPLGGSFDEGVDAVRVARGHGQPDLADLGVGKAAPFQARPGRSAVARDVQAAAGSPAPFAPGPDEHRPHAGIEDSRVRRIHRDVGTPGVLVHEEHSLPGLAAVRGAVHAALLLRPVGVAHGGGEDDVRITRVDGDPANAAGVLEPHALPGLAGVGRLVDAVPLGDVASDERLAGPGPDDVRVRGGNGKRPNRRDGLAVEDRSPGSAPVGRLEDPARGGAHVVDVRVTRDSDDGDDPVPDRTDVAELEGREGVGLTDACGT